MGFANEGCVSYESQPHGAGIRSHHRSSFRPGGLARSPHPHRELRCADSELFTPAQESLRAAEQARAELAHTRGPPRRLRAVSASQRARWRAGGGVRQCNAPLPMVCNCNRSIVANGLYPHSPDHHSTRPSTSARLPCATLRKSSPPRVGYGSVGGRPVARLLFRIRQVAAF
jgi:hypothetical protein